MILRSALHRGLTCAALALPALAQATASLPEIPPVPPQTGTPGEIAPTPIPAPGKPAPAKPAPAPVPLADVAANLFTPRSVTGPLKLTFTIRNTGTRTLVFGARRDNAQNCAVAPLLRVVRVGTGEVVYPTPGAKRLCTQDFIVKSAPVKGNASYSRELTLPVGEYMLESWFAGLANGVPVKLPAPAMRVTVK
ncbi:hypothetical protein [Deinococcus koreensis]|uniref:Intracellular proteinase inhibitor BsuPI domain-containing protein n=1 Tax=Deinococcus koreensis TaxID=2054903 RepID=A0A2K3V167_9DEIO|nr:hypothetical protein [Deinococcus koreensis]PNY82530.1 hypothetical protein CVO96_15290 [Deinococcus koreensis]